MLRSKFLRWGQTRIEKGAFWCAPLSWLWGLAAFCKNALYDAGILPVARAAKTVVSVGNIVAGGVGKTPLVILLAQQFPHRKVAILTRGYGQIADEALLLKRRLPHVSVYVGKDRAKLARQVKGADLLILDDGFQHRRLHRDFDLVILSTLDPYGKGHYLPWGFLRESPKRLKRADALFFNGPSLSHISLKKVVDQVLDARGNEVKIPRSMKAGLFCGIGQPESFKKTVASLGVEVVGEWILADHGVVDARRLRAFALKCKELGAKALLCTEKDFVKLSQEEEGLLPIYFIEISFQVIGGEAEWKKLVEKIDQKIDNVSL